MHPRFHVHFTPTSSSWLNQVERWFGLLTEKLLRRGVHKSVKSLEKDILAWVDIWNKDPKPFIWTKSAEEYSNQSGDFSGGSKTRALEAGPDSDADGFIVQWGRYGQKDRRPTLTFTRQFAVDVRATWPEPDWYQPEYWQVNLELAFDDPRPPR